METASLQERQAEARRQYQLAVYRSGAAADAFAQASPREIGQEAYELLRRAAQRARKARVEADREVTRLLRESAE